MGYKGLLYKTIVILLGFVFSFQLHGQTDVLTGNSLGIEQDGAYTTFENRKISSNAVYKGCIANNKQSGAIQMNEEKGEIYTTESSSTPYSISIDWNSETASSGTREIWVYAHNFRFGNGKESFTLGDNVFIIKKGDNKTHTFKNKYKHIGICAKGGTVYLNKITIVWNSNKISRNLAFSGNKFNIQDGEAFEAPVLSGDKLDDVTYSSSQPDVASVDATTGQVKVLNIGTTTITASAPETKEYAAASVSYELTIAPVTSLSHSLNFNYPDSVGIADIGAWTDQHSFSDKDVVVTIESGKQQPAVYKNGYNGKNDIPSIWLYPGSKLIVRLPKGLSFIETKVTGVNVMNFTKNSVQDAVIYTNIEKTPVQLKRVFGSYAGHYQVNIGGAEHVTFSARQAYVMPEGLRGGVVHQKGNDLVVSYRYQPGDRVPAEEALILKGAPGLYTLRTNTEGNSVAAAGNLLRPSFTNNQIEAPAGSKLYIFTKDPTDGLGFYWQKDSNNGTVVKNLANKAYLEISGTLSAKGFRLIEEDLTGVSVPHLSPKESPVIYTINGIRISSPTQELPHGVYIINGEKRMLK